MVYKTVQSVQKIVRIGCKSFLLQHIPLCTCHDNIILSSDSCDTHQRNVGFEAEQKSPLKTFDKNIQFLQVPWKARNDKENKPTAILKWSQLLFPALHVQQEPHGVLQQQIADLNSITARLNSVTAQLNYITEVEDKKLNRRSIWL